MVSKAFGLSQLGDTDSLRVDSANNTLQITGNLVIGGASSNNYVSVNNQNVTPVSGFKNRVINGNFDFWQRGTSVTGVGNAQYVSDRWVSFRAGSTANVSRQSFTIGQTDVPGEPTYFHRSVVSSVAGASNLYILQHPFESVRTFAGQTATLSFWAKADASKNIAVEFIQFFGTGGSPSSTVTGIGVTTCALTTAWKKFTITVNIPSISGKTLGSDNNDALGLFFWFDAGSTYNSRTNSLGQQSGTFDIAQVQLEAGPVATPFEQRPLGQELALCQRYYETEVVSGSTNNDGTFNSGVPATVYFGFKISKRASPTMAALDSNGTSNRFNNGVGLVGSAGQTATAGSLTGAPLTEGFCADFGASGTTSARFSFRYTASAEL